MTMTNADVGAGVTRTTRRVFTAEYKARMVTEYDGATDRGARGARGALLRREGLFDSHIRKWRRAQTQGRLVATPTAEAGESPATRERALTVDNERLRAELETTKAVLEVAG